MTLMVVYLEPECFINQSGFRTLSPPPPEFYCFCWVIV